MKKDFGTQSWLYPMPVLVIGTYDEEGRPDAMTAAWGGIALEDRIAICVDDSHKTTANVLARRAFTVHVADAAHLAACDYAGLVSANDTPGKFARLGFHASPSPRVDAPVFAELPMVLECELLSYDPADCRMVGRIANVAIEESCLTPDGKVDLARLDPIAYDPVNHAYHSLGPKVGNAFKAGRALQ